MTIEVLLNWDSKEIKILENLIEEYDLDIDEVRENVLENTYQLDSEVWIYEALVLAEQKIKDLLFETFPDYHKEIFNYNAYPYTNGLEYGFDSVFNDYSFEDLKNGKYLNDLLNEILISLN